MLKTLDEDFRILLLTFALKLAVMILESSVCFRTWCGVSTNVQTIAAKFTTIQNCLTKHATIDNTAIAFEIRRSECYLHAISNCTHQK